MKTLQKSGNYDNMFEKVIHSTTTIKVVFKKMKGSSKLGYSLKR